MKLLITPKILRSEYSIYKLNSYEIAQKYKCSATWVNTLRRKYKIRTLQPYERNLAQRLSQRQKEYIYGSLLGDGCIKFAGEGSKNACFSIGQSRSEYIKYQYSLLKNFINTKIKSHQDKRSPNRKRMHYFKTIQHPVFTKIYEQIYQNGVKKISEKWLNQLSPFSLAIWYMDDGSITRSSRMMRISTESFTLKDHKILQRYLKEKRGIAPRIVPSPKTGKFIFKFLAKERNKFFKLIQPFIVPGMKYKLYNAKFEKWAKEELTFLSQNYKGRKTDWENISILNHTKEAIMRKASYLGLTKRTK